MVLRHIGCKCVCVCLSVCLRVCVCVYVSVSVWVCVCLLLTELWPGITGAGCRKRCALPCRPFSRPTGGASMLARQAEYHTHTHTHTHTHIHTHTRKRTTRFVTGCIVSPSRCCGYSAGSGKERQGPCAGWRRVLACLRFSTPLAFVCALTDACAHT